MKGIWVDGGMEEAHIYSYAPTQEWISIISMSHLVWFYTLVFRSPPLDQLIKNREIIQLILFRTQNCWPPVYEHACVQPSLIKNMQNAIILRSFRNANISIICSRLSFQFQSSLRCLVAFFVDAGGKLGLWSILFYLIVSKIKILLCKL